MPGHDPPDEVLEQYSLGRLPDAEAARLEEHLLICSACQDRLADIDAYVSAVRSAASELLAPPASRWQRFRLAWRVWLARPEPALAALVVAVLVWFLIAGPWAGAHSGQPPVVVSLVAMRGAEALRQAPAGKPLALALDATGLHQLESYRLEIVDDTGRAVLNTAVHLGGVIRLPRPLDPGIYWVRLYEPGQPAALLREFGLEAIEPGSP